LLAIKSCSRQAAIHFQPGIYTAESIVIRLSKLYHGQLSVPKSTTVVYKDF